MTPLSGSTKEAIPLIQPESEQNTKFTDNLPSLTEIKSRVENLATPLLSSIKKKLDFRNLSYEVISDSINQGVIHLSDYLWMTDETSFVLSDRPYRIYLDDPITSSGEGLAYRDFGVNLSSSESSESTLYSDE